MRIIRKQFYLIICLIHVFITVFSRWLILLWCTERLDVRILSSIFWGNWLLTGTELPALSFSLSSPLISPPESEQTQYQLDTNSTVIDGSSRTQRGNQTWRLLNDELRKGQWKSRFLLPFPYISQSFLSLTLSCFPFISVSLSGFCWCNGRREKEREWEREIEV